MERVDVYLDDTHIYNVESVHEFRYNLESELSASLSDHDCLRFLRARDGDMTRAVEMAKEWNEWRHSLQSDNLKYSANFVLSCKPSELLWNHPHSHLLPCSHHDFDNIGRPVFWTRLGFIVSQFKEIMKYFSNDQLVHYIMWTHEALILRQEFSSQQRQRRIDNVVIIADMSHFPMSTFMDSHAVSMMRLLISISQRYYPETLHKLILLNTPWHFSTAFSLFSSHIRPRTLAKIAMVKDKKSIFSFLSEHLPSDAIPVDLGGTSLTDVWDSSCAPPPSTGISETQVAEYMRKKIAPSIIDKVLWPEELVAWRTAQLRMQHEEVDMSGGGDFSGNQHGDIVTRLRMGGVSAPGPAARIARRGRSRRGSKTSVSPGHKKRRSGSVTAGLQETCGERRLPYPGPVGAYRAGSGSFRGPPYLNGSQLYVCGRSNGGGRIGGRDPSVLLGIKTRIVDVEEMDSYHEYVIRVHFRENNSWKIRKRYSHFVRLHSRILAADPTIGNYPTLPPKVIFGKMAESVVIRRQAALATYLVNIIDKCAAEESGNIDDIEDVLLRFLEADNRENIEQNEACRVTSSRTSHEDGRESQQIGEYRGADRLRAASRRSAGTSSYASSNVGSRDPRGTGVGYESDVTSEDEGFEYSSSKQSVSALSFASSTSPEGSARTSQDTEKSVIIMVVVAIVFVLGLTVYKTTLLKAIHGL